MPENDPKAAAAGTGAGTGTGAGAGTGAGTGAGAGPGTGTGAGPGTGHGTGAGPGTGHGTGARAETESAPAVENLGELPAAYHDDAVVILMKNPHTLFVYWDFAPATIQAALAGLDSPRASMRIFDGPRLVRELDFLLEARSWYVGDLVPEREYRVEIHAVGLDGRGRRLGRSSNSIAVPPAAPSPVVDDRFVRVPWDLPLTPPAPAPSAPISHQPPPPPHEEVAALSPAPSEADRARSLDHVKSGGM